MFTVNINNKEIQFPSELGDITLKQRIEFDRLNGEYIKTRLEEIEAITDEEKKEIETAILNIEIACRQFAFFSGLDLVSVERSNQISNILDVYHVTNSLLANDIEVDSKTEFDWNGETWVLHEPELNPNSDMTFGELIDSKQIIQDLQDLGAGRHEILLKLCSIYLRKKGEEYDKSFPIDGSERMKLMEDLPLDIALAVSFFLSNSMNLLTNTFHAFKSLP